MVGHDISVRKDQVLNHQQYNLNPVRKLSFESFLEVYVMSSVSAVVLLLTSYRHSREISSFIYSYYV